jgi:hypothetical protein
VRLGPTTNLGIRILFQRGISPDRPGLQLGEERYTDAAEEPGQSLGRGYIASVLLMPVDKVAAQLIELFIHKDWQWRWFRQMSNTPVAHRTVTALRWNIFIAKILRQSLSQTAFSGKQLKHRVDALDFRFLVLGETSV